MIIDTLIFFGISLLLVLLFIVGYFIVREYTRIRDKVGKWEMALRFIFLIALIFAVEAFMGINLPGTEVHVSVAIIVVLVFTLRVDMKLFTPMYIGLLLGNIYLIMNELTIPQVATLQLIVVLFVYIIALLRMERNDDGSYVINGYREYSFLMSIYTMSSVVAVMIFGNSAGISLAYLLVSTYRYAIALLIYYLTGLVEKQYTNFNSLQESTFTGSSSYFKISLAKKELFRHIKDNSVTDGALVIFSLPEGTTTKQKDAGLKKIKDSTEENYEKAFFLQFSKQDFGVFIPLEKPLTDLSVYKRHNKGSKENLGELQQFVDDLKDVRVKKQRVYAGISFYGPQANDINKLYNYCTFAIKNHNSENNKSNVTFFQSNWTARSIEKYNILKSYPEYIDAFEIEYHKVKNADMYYYNVNTIKPLEDIDNKEDLDLILRFYAMRAYKMYDKAEKLILDYPITTLQREDFNIKNSLAKTSGKKSRVVYGFKQNGKLSNDQIEKINTIKESGYEVAVIDYSDATKSFIEKINPHYKLSRKRNSIEK